MPEQTLTTGERFLRQLFKVLNKFMFLMFKARLGWLMNILPAVGGRIMIIEHTGRRSGRTLYVPVNYAEVDGEIYCVSGFGKRSHWYKNLIANPQTVLWLPNGKQHALVVDVSASQDRLHLMRAVLIGSGFAAWLAGIFPKTDSDEKLAGVTQSYQLFHMKKMEQTR